MPLQTHAEAIALSDEKPLGYVVRDGGSAPVYWSGELRTIARGQASAAVLELEDVPGPGKYSGTIDLLPAATGGEVELTVAVTDAVYFAIAFLVLGLLAAFAVKRLVGVRRVKLELRERLAEINRTFARAAVEFAALAAGRPYEGYDLTEAFTAATGEALEKIDDLGKTLDVRIDAKAHDDVNGILGGMRNAADSWQPFGDDLDALEKELVTLHRLLPTLDDPLRPPGEPQVAAAPATFLDGGALGLDEYEKRRGAVVSAVDLLGIWNRLLSLLIRLRGEQEALLAKQLSDPDREKLRGLDSKMTEVANELWSVTDESELVERDIRADLVGIEQVISGFPREEAPAGESAAQVLAAPPAVAASIRSALGVKGGRPSIADWKREARNLRQRRRAIDLIVLAVATALAVMAGLSALYFGKEWGTDLDYLKAFLWGGTTEAALAGILAALGRVGPFGRALAAPATLPQLAGRPGRELV